MHLIIISGTPRPQPKSNTARIITAFCQGFQNNGNTMEIWYLSDRKQWNDAKNAFRNNSNILFVLPIYVENIPSIMLEFLGSLPYKEKQNTCLSFLIQGGFPEASQGRCCESFLKTLPEKLGCEYGGTLIKGDMFGIGLIGDKIGKKMVQPFIEVGRLFSKYGCFNDNIVSKFSSPEYLTEKQIRWFERLGKHIQKCFMTMIAKRLGCKRNLDAKFYKEKK